MKEFSYWKRNAEEYFEVLQFPEEARTRLLACLEALGASPDAYAQFSRLLEEYDESYELDYYARAAAMHEASESAGFDAREGWMVLFVSMLPRLKKYFEEKGIPEKLFYDVIPDLRYKLNECKMLDGVYGIVAGSGGTYSTPVNWYSLLFTCRLLTFSRLQFVFQEAKFECECEGVKIEKDTPVLNIHIPRTGGKLDREGVLCAYREAAEYYAKDFGDRPIVMTTRTWMFFPRHAEFLSPTSNMMQFYNDFHLVDSGEYGGYGETWRLFGCTFTGDLSALPTDNTLRRAYVELMKRGEKTGWGRGVMIYKK